MATRENTLSAQTTVTASTSKFGDFKPLVGATKSILHTLEVDANHSKSMKLLDEAGLRPLEYQEILPLLMKDEQLKNSLKGKWFYLDGVGLNIADGIYTIDEKGELAKTAGKEISIENKVRVWNGPNPLSLGVDSDYGAAGCGGRFDLFASNGLHGVAPVVVGVPKLSSELEPEQVAKMLRVDQEGQKVVITSPDGKKTEINALRGSTVKVE